MSLSSNVHTDLRFSQLYTTFIDDLFSVTAWHELVGTIIQYIKNPKGVCMVLKPGVNQSNVQSYMQGNREVY